MTELTEAMVADAAKPTTITYDGKTYHFTLGFHEAAEVEKIVGVPFIQMLADFSKSPSLTVLRAVFRVAINDGEYRGPLGLARIFGAQAADKIIAGLGTERGTQLLAFHASRVIDAITGGTGGVEVDGLPPLPVKKRRTRKAATAE